MEGFNGFFLERENGKKLKLVTDFVLNKKTYYLFEDGNYYYEGYLKKAQASKTITVYWRWEYYVSTSQDSTDTGIGEAADSTVVTATITGTQVDPTTASVGYDE